MNLYGIILTILVALLSLFGACFSQAPGDGMPPEPVAQPAIQAAQPEELPEIELPEVPSDPEPAPAAQATPEEEGVGVTTDENGDILMPPIPLP